MKNYFVINIGKWMQCNNILIYWIYIFWDFLDMDDCFSDDAFSFSYQYIIKSGGGLQMRWQRWHVEANISKVMLSVMCNGNIIAKAMEINVVIFITTETKFCSKASSCVVFFFFLLWFKYVRPQNNKRLESSPLRLCMLLWNVSFTF